MNTHIFITETNFAIIVTPYSEPNIIVSQIFNHYIWECLMRHIVATRRTHRVLGYDDHLFKQLLALICKKVCACLYTTDFIEKEHTLHFMIFCALLKSSA
jgi:hypothetical protein